MSDKTTEERIAELRAAEDAFRAALSEFDLDGPHRFPDGGMFGAMFDSPRSKFAVCLKCGAMVALHDPEETTDGRQIERGVRLHSAWHATAAQPGESGGEGRAGGGGDV